MKIKKEKIVSTCQLVRLQNIYINFLITTLPDFLDSISKKKSKNKKKIENLF